MKTIALVATGAAALFAVMVFATTAADARRGGGGFARGGGHSFGGRSMARAPRMAHRAPAMRRAPVPSVGNVTVPEDYYDRFYAYVAQDPPDYSSACKLLVEAVAADTVAASSPGTKPDLGSQPR